MTSNCRVYASLPSCFSDKVTISLNEYLFYLALKVSEQGMPRLVAVREEMGRFVRASVSELSAIVEDNIAQAVLTTDLSREDAHKTRMPDFFRNMLPGNDTQHAWWIERGIPYPKG